MKSFARRRPLFLNFLSALAAALAISGCKLPPGTFSASSVFYSDPPTAEPDLDFGALGATAENATARFLAGLPGGGGGDTRLAAARRGSAWREHSRRMDAAFAAAQPRLSAIAKWRRTALGGDDPGVGVRLGIGAAGSHGTLFYPFSGPDFLYADAFFPHSKTLVLCGLEPVGELPDAGGVPAADLPTALAALRTSIATPLLASYFITKDMRTDLASGAFRGVTPVLLTFLARTGHRVLAADPIALDAAGGVVPRPGEATGTAPGVRIKAASAGGGVRTVYYFRTELSNATLAGDPRFLTFVRNQNPSATFVKSASYLMHSGEFSIIRDAVKSVSPMLLQDPTGVPYRQLVEGGWDIALYGNYRGTLDIFSNNYQPDLAAAYRASGARPMGFGIGYKWSPAESSLIVATRPLLRGAAAQQ